MINESFDLVLVTILAFILAGILYVVFGFVTVRKLRKNQKTKDSLGMEVVSGSDVVGVAQTLSMPRSWARKLDKKNSLYGEGVVANSDLLYENTTVFDRFLARFFYWVALFAILTAFVSIALGYQ